jgi:hypothetical protein
METRGYELWLLGFILPERLPLTIPVTRFARRDTHLLGIGPLKLPCVTHVLTRHGQHKPCGFGTLCHSGIAWKRSLVLERTIRGLDVASIPHSWLAAAAGSHRCRYRMAKGRGKSGRWVHSQDTHQSGNFDAAS